MGVEGWFLMRYWGRDGRLVLCDASGMSGGEKQRGGDNSKKWAAEQGGYARGGGGGGSFVFRTRRGVVDKGPRRWPKAQRHELGGCAGSSTGDPASVGVTGAEEADTEDAAGLDGDPRLGVGSTTLSTVRM